MRLQIASDLHHHREGEGLATGRRLEVAEDVDYLVLAGNVHAGTEAMRLYGNARVPVLLVHGFIELHGLSRASLRKGFASFSAGASVQYLERRVLIVGSVRVLGCCLWTNYRSRLFPGSDPCLDASACLRDLRLIRSGERCFRAEDAYREHQQSRRWLERELAKPFGGKTVVVTHFAPTFRSLPLSMRRRPVAVWYASSMDEVMPSVDLWVHGRVPDTLDYTVGTTRVVCNARGLPWERDRPRRPFEPGFTVDI